MLVRRFLSGALFVVGAPALIRSFVRTAERIYQSLAVGQLVMGELVVTVHCSSTRSAHSSLRY